jgi:hypothetical protein
MDDGMRRAGFGQNLVTTLEAQEDGMPWRTLRFDSVKVHALTHPQYKWL